MSVLGAGGAEEGSDDDGDIPRELRLSDNRTTDIDALDDGGMHGMRCRCRGRTLAGLSKGGGVREARTHVLLPLPFPFPSPPFIFVQDDPRKARVYTLPEDMARVALKIEVYAPQDIHYVNRNNPRHPGRVLTAFFQHLFHVRCPTSGWLCGTETLTSAYEWISKLAPHGGADAESEVTVVCLCVCVCVCVCVCFVFFVFFLACFFNGRV